MFLQIHFEWKVGHVMKLSATALALNSLISQQLSHYASPNRARHLNAVLYRHVQLYIHHAAQTKTFKTSVPHLGSEQRCGSGSLRCTPFYSRSLELLTSWPFILCPGALGLAVKSALVCKPKTFPKLYVCNLYIHNGSLYLCP